MPHAHLKRTQRTHPRGPFVFDTRTLGAASAYRQTRTASAPPDLGSGLVRVPEGSDLMLEVQLEEVSEGVLVTASVSAELAGECARCLEQFTSSMEVSFRELFAAQASGSEDDGYLLDGDLLDLEPAVRDALVLELPLSPLCGSDCAGLCATCGVRLAEAEPGHHHSDDGGVWAVLKDLFGDQGDEQGTGTQVQDHKVAGTTDPGSSKER